MVMVTSSGTPKAFSVLRKRAFPKSMESRYPGYLESPAQRRRLPRHFADSEDSNPDVAPGSPASDSDRETSRRPRERLHSSYAKNFRAFRATFGVFRVDRRRGLLCLHLESGKIRYLHASLLNKYFYVNPIYYHPNLAIRDINTRNLLQKLGQFKSANARALYESPELLAAVRLAYLDCFRAGIESEAELRGRFRDFCVTVANAVAARRPVDPRVGATLPQQSVRFDSERYAAAAGFLCAMDDERGDVDREAGYMGKTDAVLLFGEAQRQSRPQRTEEDVFCAMQFKLLRTREVAVGHRWFTVSGALLAQTLQSVIGHDAHVALAFTEQGYRVFLVEYDAENDNHTISAWPPANQSFYNRVLEDDGLKILTNIVRIATRSVSNSLHPLLPLAIPLAAQTDSSSQLADHGDPAPSPSSPFRAQQRRGVKRSIAKKGDKVFKLKTVSGEMVEVKKICLKSRFTEEELREIHELEKQLAREPFPASSNT